MKLPITSTLREMLKWLVRKLLLSTPRTMLQLYVLKLIHPSRFPQIQINPLLSASR